MVPRPDPKAPAERPATLAPWAIALLAAWSLTLLLAPPLSTRLWALNGFRSLSLEQRLILLAAAAASGLLVWRGRGRAVWAAAALVLALALAIPLRESSHYLHDTDLRFHSIADFAARTVNAPLSLWSQRLHMSLLDLCVDLVIPARLVRAGLAAGDAVAGVGWCLAVLYLAALWRAAGALGRGHERLALAALLALSGTLQAFAGYAASAALVLTAMAWWWCELARPLDRWPRAFAASLAWLTVALAHRAGLVLLLPQLLRAFMPWPGDQPRARAVLVASTLAGAAAAMWVPGLDWGARQAGVDVGPLRSALGQLTGLRLADVANGLILVAPLALAAPILVAGTRGADRAGRARWRAAVSLRVALALAGALPLGLIAVVGWCAPNGLGPMRDWDLAAPAGLLLSFAAVAALAEIPGTRRASLAWIAPVLALQAGAWLAVNADARAGQARAIALAERPGLPPDQRGTLFTLFASQAMERGDTPLAARLQRRGFELSPDVPRGTLAAEWLLLVGDRAGARSVLARVRTLEAPDSQTARILSGLDSLARRGPH